MVYLSLGLLGFIVMSYLGSVAERSKPGLYRSIAWSETRTFWAQGLVKRSTVGGRPHHRIRKAQATITAQQFSNTPFHFCSHADQQRSSRLYLL
jgi:hypothetical protein